MDSLFNEITQQHKVRFYKGQKQKFRDYAVKKFSDLGYAVSVDRHKNIIAGNIDSAKYVATAHYDTPPLSFYLTPFTRIFGHLIGMIIAPLLLVAVLFFLMTLIASISDITAILSPLVILLPILLFLFPNPNNANDNTSGIISILKLAEKLKDNDNVNEYAFILFNCEEWGLLGSMGFRKDYFKKHKCQPQFEVYNLDCVALGDKLLLARKYNCSAFEKVKASAERHGIPVTPITANLFTVASDNICFNNSVMLTTVKKSLLGPFYLPAIHMPHDKKVNLQLMESVVEILHSALSNN